MGWAKGADLAMYASVSAMRAGRTVGLAGLMRVACGSEMDGTLARFYAAAGAVYRVLSDGVRDTLRA